MLHQEKDIIDAFPDVFEQYRFLVSKADFAFEEVERDHRDCVKCRTGCSDCCYAVFGVFIVEAVNLRFHFLQLEDPDRKAALRRADKAERELREVERKLSVFDDDPHVKSFALAKERVRCPLLDQEDRCIVYDHRPITCRVYGMPTAIHGNAHVCGKAGFEKGKSYPVYKLDVAYKVLYRLSRELMRRLGRENSEEKASLMLSVSNVISNQIKELLG
ncbi:MAG: YkgJ family cysteine cluster protein [Deltaproteobacteria bacterium]|nr:YkgJ family cysteine cluster protein [Deltaproteobacteria bacterium]